MYHYIKIKILVNCSLEKKILINMDSINKVKYQNHSTMTLSTVNENHLIITN